MPDDDIRLLALDGGGVRGLSSLMILRSLMALVDPDNPPKPCDYFDMIGGTSTGGLIAVMLGRLRMSVDDCISEYITLSDKVFQKKGHRIRINGQLQGRFDSGALEGFIKEVLKRTGHDEKVLLKDLSGTCKVFVCATSKQTSGTVCLTSYRTSQSTDLLDTTKVWQACRATSAATTFFDPIALGVPEEEFVDGALGMNNPVFALWSQAQDVWGDRLRGSLRCLVSIGTGMPALQPVRDDVLGILSTLEKLATDTEKTAEQFRRDKVDLDNDGRYFRFNVARGLENIGLEESKKQKEIGAATRLYVQSQEIVKQMTALANGLAKRQYLGPYKTRFSLAGVPVSAKFVDRPSDTARLEECLLPRRSQREGKKVFVLHGLGGVGKTQLAVDFTRRHHVAFSAVFWLDGRSEDRLRRSIAAYVDRIPEGQVPSATRRQAEGRSTEDLDAAVAGVIGWLGRADNRNWLLVFDNVDLDHEQDGVEGAYDVRQYLTWDHGAALITTRVSRLAQLAPPGHSRKLARVDGGLGMAILEAWHGGPLGPDADKLLTLLDGLPLALAQAASYLRETGVSVSKYLKVYQNQWDELMAPRSNRPLLDYEQGSIATTWTVSFRQIEAKDDHAASLLRLWAFLDNEHLWHGLLTVAAELSEKWPVWLQELAASEVRFLGAVGLLLRYSIIEAQEDVENGYSMHPVVHKWASQLNGGSHRAKHARLALMVVGLSVPTDIEKKYWVMQRQLLPHAQRCAEWVQKCSVESLEHIDEDMLRPLHNLGSLYADQGKLAEAEKIYQRALAGREKALGPDHEDTLTTVNKLGNVYTNQGKLAEAEEMYQRSLAGREKALGPDHKDTLTTVNNLGVLYRVQGKLAEADKIFWWALDGYEKTLGPNHTSTLMTVVNLGNLYSDQGKLIKAEEMYQRALVGYKKALGPDHTNTLLTVNNLGLLYVDQGKLDKADEMYQRALDGYEKALGPAHTVTLTVVHNLGHLYVNQGKLDKADKMYQRALAGREKALGHNHMDTLTTINNFGALYHNQNRLAEAENMYQRALAGREEALGPCHKDTLTTIDNLGVLYHNQGKMAEAEAMYLRALTGYEKALGPYHPNTRLVLRNLELLQETAEGPKEGKLWRAKTKFRAVLHWPFQCIKRSSRRE